MSVVGEGGGGVPLSRDPRTCLDRQGRASVSVRTDAADTAFSSEATGTGPAPVPTQTHAFRPDRYRDLGRCRPRHTQSAQTGTGADADPDTRFVPRARSMGPPDVSASRDSASWRRGVTLGGA
jgi:hypothetical protein